MMDRIRLGDILHIKHGYAFKGEYFTDKDTGKLVLTPGNFSLKGGFQNTKKFTSEIDFPEEFILKPGDLIVTMTDLSKEIDTIGYSAIVPNDGKQYLHNQRIGLVTINNSEFDKGFVYWLMRSKHYQRSIANTSNGATVHHTSPDRIYNYQFEIISIDTQRRIASILSAYDNLIENNNRRIRLLEQMAENLYKEWFVRFRFPGHEKAEFENGLPKGWRVVTIKDICNVTDGVHNTIQDTPQSKYYLLSCKNIKDGKLIIGENERTIDEETFLKLRKRTQLAKGDILVSSVGTIGETILLNEDPTFFEFQRSVAMIKPDKRYVNSNFMYEMLKYMRKDLVNAAHGVAQQCLFLGDINKIRVFLPAMHTIAAFGEKVQPIYDQILSLSKQLNLLSRQRDLLLPRLMSGKLEVKC